MNTPTEVQAENEIMEAIELGKKLARLKKNKDYIAVIEQLFLDGGAVNLAKNITVVKDRDSVIEQIVARGCLYRTLMTIEEDAENAMYELEQNGKGD